MTAQTVLEKELTIVNRRGLHARASAKLVKLVEMFEADVQVSKDGQTVGGTSIMGLMMLAASPGCYITVSVTGTDADDAMTAIAELVESGFGEED
ncbi:probable phosphocarrier protein HPr protein (component of the phosphoenolpyruvate-dependent sugarphosphotransferase [Stappia aggregata IAM 12614]|uniref:Probable phosphocarrier protein HPr protein (component of the phosphoenolpyruvate-dependent sugarphosphotransferase) n=1 Tax=Roseibium aggregatum (strain ATCC 25650 / DSM 13394 / JCM 20685 / NBRC 16684 / NCIMB 2208 / IAM 12614 / B1) TaxID=384765 RepID=A0NUU2_ROSAI|nr:HPr family phosphocarrier protein [Roseibium aggregatum]EAV43694.1 probable phosphocarrier protein HPr protein (component of the phosphoenolpyruvate-dependent sugarphosphotransferase [Stappia aggregata IAM 12614] [Roseibium aggregatum IAM 12614]